MNKISIILKRAMFASLMTINLAGCGGSNITEESKENSSINQSSEASSSSDNYEVTEPVTLTYWHGFTGADGDSMSKMVEAFNAEYKGKITIKMEVYTWDTLFTKLFTTTTNVKYMPHIVAMSANRVAGTKAKKLLATMDDIMDRFELDQDDFIPATYTAGVIDDHRYSFPLDMHPTAIYYNKELIDESELPTTWDEFLTVCKEKTKNGVYGWAIPNQYSITKDIFYSMLLQEGEDILTDDNKINLNTTKAVNILNKLETWKYTDVISPSSVGNAGDYSLFKSGKSVFYFDGPWTINSMEADEGLNFEYGTFAMPGSTGESGTSFAGSHQLTLINKTVTTDNLKNASYIFINYLTEHSLDWAKAGQVPARLSVHEEEEFKKLTTLAPFVEEAYHAQLGNTDYQYFYEAYNYMGSAVSNALNTQEMDAETELSKKAKQFNRFLAEEE